MADLNELRRQVKAAQTRANKKVSRLRGKGVNVAGTTYDPRRNISNIKKYNAKQLTSYLGQLNSFVDRATGFVPGAEGVPINKAEWNAYKRAEAQYNKIAQSHYESVSKTFIPRQGMTVAQYDEHVRGNTPRAKGGANRPLEPVARDSINVANEDKLRKLRKQLESKAQQKYLPGQIKMQRKLVQGVVDSMGDPELSETMQSLTNDQFDTMFNYTDAARDVFSTYQFLRLLNANNADETQANVHDNDREEVREWLQWAKSLPPRGNRKNRR